MVDTDKYQTIKETALFIDELIPILKKIISNPDMGFPEKIIIDNIIYFEADAVKKWQEIIEEIYYK